MQVAADTLAVVGSCRLPVENYAVFLKDRLTHRAAQARVDLHEETST